MAQTPRWEQELWTDLEAMPLDEQIVSSGEWITHITRDLLTQLGRHRRYAILAALEDGTDDGILADRIGSRRSTIARLAMEARALKRGEAA